jgi:hypothetical protein
VASCCRGSDRGGCWRIVGFVRDGVLRCRVHEHDGRRGEAVTDNTVPHWHGSFTDPTNGVTYGYSMVGTADPRTPGLGTLRVPTDVIPLNFVFEANDGLALNVGDALPGLLHSPIFEPFN